MSGLRIAVLGPLRIERDDIGVPLGPQLTALTSTLLLEPGGAIPARRLIDLLWTGAPPDGAGATLRSHVSHLRRALGPDLLVTVGRGASLGYRLDVDPDAVDSHRFVSAFAQAQRADDAARSLALLDEALALWRGPAYADIAHQPFALPQIARLQGLRQAARRDRAEALSALGRHDEAARELRSLLGEDPFDEALRRLLVVALYARRKVAEAAEVCREGLELLHHHGIDSPELHDLQRLVLRRELSSDPETEAPRQLPADPPVLVGRDDVLRAAVAHLRTPRRGPTVLLVTGPAGVGKTSVAVRLGHEVADDFPDGALYADLCPAGAPAPPATVLHGFLDALGVAPNRIPDDLSARAAKYRSRLGRRRMLVLLDNARDAAQVHDLIPGSAGCAVVVTSRNKLPGLVSSVGARPFPLELLPPESARELFTARAGRPAKAGDEAALTRIVERCAGLPLALAIVAAHAATRPHLALSALAAQLAGVHNGLAADLRAVFSWSYLALAERDRQMFRVLGLFPGVTIGTPAAASLAGTTEVSAGAALASLAESNMVTELPGGRFATHDLLRAYALELAARDGDAPVRRLVDHCLHLAEAADRLLWPHRHRRGTPTVVAAFDDQEQATAWLTVEQPVLLALLDAPTTDDVAIAALARAMTTFLYRSLQPGVVLSVATAALRATERAGDRWGQADALRERGLALILLDRHAEAADTLDTALRRFRDLDDHVGMADTHLTLGWLADQQARLGDGLHHDREALALFVRAGDVAGQARALNAVGWDHARLGNHAEALRHCRRAVRLHQERDDSSGAARAYDSIGYALHHLGHYSEALDNLRCALAIHRADGDLFPVAETLTHLGDTLHASGSTGEARAAWEEAQGILGHSAAIEIRERLSRTR
ncbi:BTAD domain-containing putative transcriptional regulator [Asanoa sp. NPDC049518]|uniref:AfsR/SARP family transcriptional regulator n=1 Tax=unclassified Asanoa TaxID=2685164 RepID=UPI003424ED66